MNKDTTTPNKLLIRNSLKLYVYLNISFKRINTVHEMAKLEVFETGMPPRPASIRPRPEITFTFGGIGHGGRLKR